MYHWNCTMYRIFRMSKHTSNSLVMLLLAVIATVPLIGQGTSLMPAVHERPADCHQHGTAPVPQPVSYRCCQSGHDSAILQNSSASQPEPADLTSPVELSEVLIPNIAHQSLRHPVTLSADPPDITPLRV
jgi:hypothetical protein